MNKYLFNIYSIDENTSVPLKKKKHLLRHPSFDFKG